MARIELFSDPGTGRITVSDLYDETTGRFGGPAMLNVSSFLPVHAVGVQRRAQSLSPPRRLAILDSGVLREHPVLRPQLASAVDFTGGDDPEDRDGHGTAVALLLVAAQLSPAYLLPDELELHSAKVWEPSAPNDEKALVRGLEWAREIGAEVVNVSCGVRRRFCRGGCDVCKAAKRLADAGTGIAAAAGNDPRRVACPARVGLRGYPLVTCSRFDREGKNVTATSTLPYKPTRFASFDLQAHAAAAEASAARSRDLESALQSARASGQAGDYRATVETLERAFSLSAEISGRPHVDEIVSALVQGYLAAGDVDAAATALHEKGRYLSHPAAAAALAAYVAAASKR